jgi:ferredoxin
MLDAGIQLEPARSRAVEQLGASAPSHWDPKLLAFLHENMSPTAKGLPNKLLFGSDFPYRESDTQLACTFDGIGLRPSLARGGLSNVWGAAIMPYIDSDLNGWPIGTAQLAEHYSAVLKFTGISAREDDLAAIFPLYTNSPGKLELSRQARAFLSSLERNKAVLNREGIHYGTARLALRAQNSTGQSGCVYCGHCMYGCPYGYIYNSASTLSELQKDSRFTYQPDTIVHNLSESPDGVVIHARDRTTGSNMEIKADRVYLAGGVIPTTRLLLESRRCYDQTLQIKDSQYFLLPLLLPKAIPQVEREALYTLSQLFLEIFDERISSNSIHLQIYSYSDLVSAAMRKSLGKFGLNFDFLARQLEQRLLVVQGFMHSNISSTITATLRPAAPGAIPRFELKAQINPRASQAARKLASKLLRNTFRLGAFPLTPMMEIAEPGRSFHNGSSFPMSLQPGPFETDILGRPFDWQRIHAVDATILPTIPATTITLSVMANAHRIGWESAALI